MSDATPHADPFRPLTEHRGWIRRLAAGIVVDGNDVDDVEQQTWLAAIEAGGDGAGPLRGWFRSVARNAALKRLRSRRRVEGRERRAGPPPPPESPDARAARLDAHLQVTQAVQALEPAYRDVILLRYFDDLPVAQVAERLGIPLETTRTRLRRAREMLRARLEREHGTGRTRALLLLLLPARGPAPPTPWTWRTTEQAAGVAAAVTAVVVAVVMTVSPDSRPSDGAVTPPSTVARAGDPGAERAPQPRRVPRDAEDSPSITNAPPGQPAQAPASAEPWGVENDRDYRIVDATGAAIPGAAASALLGPRGRTLARHETAGPDGWITIGCRRGDRLEFFAAGFAPVVGKLNEFPREEVVLYRRVAVGGTVVDGEGRPVAGARGTVEQGDTRATFVTGVDGRFHVNGFSQGIAGGDEPSLAVEAQGYLHVYRIVTPGRRDLNVVLERPCRVEGRVLDPQGRPAAQAEVFFWGAREEAQGAKAVTDAQGRFRIDNLHHGRHVVQSRHGHAIVPYTQRSDRWTAPRGVETLVELEPREQRTGLELRLEPLPVSFAVVRLFRNDGSVASGLRTWIQSRETRSTGFYEQPDDAGIVTHRVAVAPGTEVDLLVDSGGKEKIAPATVRVTTTARADARPQDRTLPRGMRWTLVLRDPAGRRVVAQQGTRVRLGALQPVGYVVTDWGRDLVEVLLHPEASGPVAIECPGYAPAVIVREPLAAPPARTVVTLVPEAVVSGVVHDAHGGPLAGVDVFVRSVEAGAARMRRRTTDRGGTFRLAGLTPGEVTVEFGRSELTEQRVSVVLQPGEQRDLGTVQLDGWRTVGGRVLDGQGAPLAGASVTFSARTPVGYDAEREHGVATDVDGRFALRLPRAARGTLWFEHETMGLQRRALEPGADEPAITIRLRQAARLRVLLHLPPGTSYRGGRLQPDDGGPAFEASTVGSMEHELGASETLEFDRLRAGGIAFHAQLGRAFTAPRTHTVRAHLVEGATTELIIDLRTR